jgi:hypothetical protein
MKKLKPLPKSIEDHSKIVDKNYAILHIYVPVAVKYGYLSALILGYLEYLDRSGIPDKIVSLDGNEPTKFFALSLSTLTDDMRTLLRTHVSRQMIQSRSKQLLRANIIYREATLQGKWAENNRLWYAVNPEGLTRFILGREDAGTGKVGDETL